MLLARKVNEAGGQVLLDHRIRRGGSHHQKLVVIRHGAGAAEADVAFAGGIDLARGRNDDARHYGDPQPVRLADSRYGERSLWWLLWERMRGTPSIVSILMRSGTVGSEAQRRVVRDQADFLFEPPMPEIGLRDWKSLDQAIAEGYAHARMRIEQHGIPLSDVWSDGPAVARPQRAVE